MSALSAGNFKPLENKEDIGKAPCQSSIFGVKYKPNMKNILGKLGLRNHQKSNHYNLKLLQ